MKKAGILIIISLLFISPLILQIALAQDIAPGLPEELQQSPEELAEELKEKGETKWDYLSEQWQNIMLKNRFISALDSFFSKISIVFYFLFGQPYALSLTLLIVIILWIYFFFKFAEMFKNIALFSPGVSYLIGFGITVIVAQLQILRKIVEWFGWFIFTKDATWWRTLAVGIIVLSLILIYVLTTFLGKMVKEKREKLEKEKEKIERGVLHKTVEEIEKGLK